jgi:uncharacterized protein YozE (UPF0346 family)
MKFYEWLRYQRHREDGVGDFARDVFWDREAPKDSEDPETWRAYAKKRGLPFILASFEQAWQEFKKQYPHPV